MDGARQNGNAAHAAVDAFSHEALLYRGEEGFMAATLPFLEEGIAAGEPALVAVSAAKAARLQAELGPDADQVMFANMSELGKNPARIIPAWREFVDINAVGGQRVRGIGEPVWPGRSEQELVECHHHESLLNLAFDGGPAWRLMCPYDVDALEPEVVEAARRTHPQIVDGDQGSASRSYLAPQSAPSPFEGQLPAPSVDPDVLGFSASQLADVRRFVADRARRAELDDGRVSDLVLAASELASNSVRHGGGTGTMRVWSEPDALICEVEDSGRIDELLVGRQNPTPHQFSGRGLWLVNHLCDFVQIRSTDQGAVVRARMTLS
jgi:anti-sigma regulatory factor (Ser/Thr protein kinase)